MTDSEIIKALECCSKSTKEGDWNVCENECPYKSKCYDKDENVDFMQDVATLVNRQKEEIERLQKYNTAVAFKHYNDGVKDVVKRVKAKSVVWRIDNFDMGYKITDEELESIVKEMVGE